MKPIETDDIVITLMLPHVAAIKDHLTCSTDCPPLLQWTDCDGDLHYSCARFEIDGSVQALLHCGNGPMRCIQCGNAEMYDDDKRGSEIAALDAKEKGHIRDEHAVREVLYRAHASQFVREAFERIVKRARGEK